MLIEAGSSGPASVVYHGAMPGPVPKRSNQRRRKNKPDIPIVTAPGASEVPIPEPEEDWHPIAASWYKALIRSGQSAFYEPSDWAAAVIIAESMSRDLKPQFLGISEVTGEVVRGTVPINGTRLSGYLKAWTALLVTEGDRRRARVELERPKPDDGEGTISWIDEHRRSG